MKKNLSREIEIPEGVEVTVAGNVIKINGKEGENLRELKLGKVKMEKKDSKIILSYSNSTKKEKKIINTNAAHIKNMIDGAKEKFIYELKIAASHFPMTVKVENGTAFIKNFLGEKKERKCKLPLGVEVDVKGSIITIKSQNKEKAGQAAANFEAATKVGKRDRRVFQDGIYIINKSGKEI